MRRSVGRLTDDEFAQARHLYVLVESIGQRLEIRDCEWQIDILTGDVVQEL